MYKPSSKTKEPDSPESAYDYAVFLLSLRLRTVGEVREKMEKRGFTQRVIEKTIDDLHSQRYLDDERYAEIFLDNLKAYKNFGYFGIKKKFLQKKLPLKLVDKILEHGLSKQDELVIAKRILKKEGFAIKEQQEDEGVRYSSFRDDGQSKEKAKMANRLKSRGFRSDVIARLIF